MVEECKLKVVYVSPPQPPSPVPEGSEEGSSPRGSVSENGNFNDTELNTVSSQIPFFLFSLIHSFSQFDLHAFTFCLQQATRGYVERLEPQDKSAEVKDRMIFCML